MTRNTPSRTKPPAIALDGVKFHWPGKVSFGLAIDSLTVSRSERVLLLGPSGAGKSTLLNLVCGIVIPQTGTIELLGEDIEAISASARDRFRAEHLGIVFQMFNLLPYASAADNVLLPLGFASKRRERAAMNRPIRDEAIRLLSTLGIEQPLSTGIDASQLSIGQQQRVAVARALIGEPEIIVADEPTSALDDLAQERFLDLLFSQLDLLGSTLLMVSHDQRLAGRFDRTIRLDEIAQTIEAHPA